MAVCTAAALGVATHAAAQQPAANDGKTLYEANCRMCHGPRGIPPQTMAKMMKVPQLDSAYFAKHTEDSVLVVLKKGKGTNMKSFADRLTAEQMLAIAQYLRTMIKTP
jgi:mono/diheme cytochrome c family protein